MIEKRDSLAMGEPVSIYNRLIVPITHSRRLYDGAFYTASTNPVAFIVIDGDEVFLSIIDEDMDRQGILAFLTSINDNDFKR